MQGRITVGLPLVAVFISTCLALVGNHQRVGIETDIQRKFEMTAALGGLTTLMVNAETGMRGYLLTGQSEYVEPFDQVSDELPATMARLTGLERQLLDDRIADINAIRERDYASVFVALIAALAMRFWPGSPSSGSR